MHVVDKDLKIIFQNPAMNQWLKSLDINSDIKGKTIFKAFPFLDQDKVNDEYSKIFKEKKPLITVEATELSKRLVYTQTLKIPIIREGQVNQIITILRDITDQKEGEINLKLSEEKYKNIITNLMDIVIILDLKGSFQYVSPQIYEVAGFIPEEVIGKNGFKFMHPDDVKNAAETLRKAILDKKKVYIEYRTIHKDGYYIDVSASGRIVNFEGEDKIFAVIKDITDQKRAKQKLTESEEKYRLITENVNDMIAILNDRIEYEYINEAAFRSVMGRDREDLISINALRWVHPDDRNKCITTFEQGWEKGESNVQARFLDAKGKYHWLDIRGTKIYDVKGEEKVLIVSRDISERKEYEKKLEISEEKYRYLIENALEGVWAIDSNAISTLVNPTMANMLGYSVEEMIGKSLFSFMGEEEAKIAKIQLEKRKKGISGERDGVYIHKNGKKVYFRIKATPIFDTEGNYEGTYAFLADITHRKIADQKLKESEEKFRTLFEIAPASIVVSDLEGKIILSNQKFCNLHGVKNPSLLEGRKILEFVAEKDWPTLKEAMKKSLNGLPRGLNHYTMRREDGTEFQAEAISLGIKNKNGEITSLIGVAQDITERKIAEQKLKESEEKYSHLFISSPYSIIITNMNGLIVDCNFLEDKITGFSKEEIIGENILDLPMFPKSTLPLVIEDFKTLLKGGIPKTAEIQIFTKDGTQVWVQPTASIFKIEGESYIQIIMQEISERKISEEKLKESEEKFRTMAEQSFMGIIILQDGVFKYFNEQAAIMNGYSKEAIQNWEPYEFQKLIYPEDKEFVMEQARKKQAGDPNVITNYQYRIVRKDGEIIWVENFSRTINYEGRPADFVMTIDISDKIKAEESLKESEEKYRLISENTDDLIVVYNEDGIVEYLNVETHSRVLEYNSEKFYDKSFRDRLVHKDDRVLADQSVREGIKKGTFQYQFRLKHKSGNYLWFEVTGKNFLDNYGNKKILCVSRNINEEKLAEQKIKESEENFRTIAEQAFIGTLIIQDDKVEYANNALLQIFDFSYAEIENWTKGDLIKLIYPEDLQYLREYREKLRSGESEMKPYYSYRVFTKYGKIKWIDQFSRPIIYRGKPAELITIMDITEKKKAEEELIKLNSLKSELLRRTSHELKTPLVSIKGFSDLLLTVHRDKIDDYVLATVREIKLGCERLENLIQDILKTAELESESVEIKKIEEDLAFLIKLCVRELQGLIRLRNHEINLDIHDKLITMFEPDQLHLVLSNLINNAIKYTPPNGKIYIKSALTDDYILISIEDNGIGLTNEEKKRLFTQFGKIERYGQGLDIISEGSGLGLYITKKIIELHGGTIKIKSKGRNKGSTFYFTLPLIKEKTM